MLRFAVFAFLCGIITTQALTAEEDFKLRCLLLSGLKNKLSNLVSGGGIVNQYPPQIEYIYYYPEYEYIYVDYPYMPEFTNGYYEYYSDNGNGYYQVIELDDQSFYSDPYFQGQGPYYIYREQHQNNDYFFTNRKIQDRIQKFRISKRAFDDLAKKNENVRNQILANREEPKQRPVQFPQTRPVENQTPNVPVTPLGGTRAPQPSPSPQYIVMGRQPMPPRGAILVRAPTS